MQFFKNKKKVKVTFYLNSGQTISLRFDNFTFTRASDGALRSWEYEGNEKVFAIDIDQVAAMVIDHRP